MSAFWNRHQRTTFSSEHASAGVSTFGFWFCWNSTMGAIRASANHSLIEMNGMSHNQLQQKSTSNPVFATCFSLHSYSCTGLKVKQSQSWIPQLFILVTSCVWGGCPIFETQWVDVTPSWECWKLSFPNCSCFWLSYFHFVVYFFTRTKLVVATWNRSALTVLSSWKHQGDFWGLHASVCCQASNVECRPHLWLFSLPVMDFHEDGEMPCSDMSLASAAPRRLGLALKANQKLCFEQIANGAVPMVSSVIGQTVPLLRAFNTQAHFLPNGQARGRGIQISCASLYLFFFFQKRSSLWGHISKCQTWVKSSSIHRPALDWWQVESNKLSPEKLIKLNMLRCKRQCLQTMRLKLQVKPAGPEITRARPSAHGARTLIWGKCRIYPFIFPISQPEWQIRTGIQAENIDFLSRLRPKFSTSDTATKKPDHSVLQTHYGTHNNPCTVLCHRFLFCAQSSRVLQHFLSELRFGIAQVVICLLSHFWISWGKNDGENDCSLFIRTEQLQCISSRRRSEVISQQCTSTPIFFSEWKDVQSTTVCWTSALDKYCTACCYLLLGSGVVRAAIARNEIRSEACICDPSFLCHVSDPNLVPADQFNQIKAERFVSVAHCKLQNLGDGQIYTCVILSQIWFHAVGLATTTEDSIAIEGRNCVFPQRQKVLKRPNHHQDRLVPVVLH